MANSIIKTTKVVVIFGILLIALLSVLVVLDVFNSTELTQGAVKVIEIAAILVATSSLIILVSNLDKK